MKDKAYDYNQLKQDVVNHRDEVVRKIKAELGDSLNEEIEGFVNATDKSLESLYVYSRLARYTNGGSLGNDANKSRLIISINYIDIMIGDIDAKLEECLNKTSKYGTIDTGEYPNLKNVVKDDIFIPAIKQTLAALTMNINNYTSVLSNYSKNITLSATGRAH